MLTSNQIAFWTMKEKERTNRANEDINRENVRRNAAVAERNAATNVLNAQTNQKNADTKVGELLNSRELTRIRSGELDVKRGELEQNKRKTDLAVATSVYDRAIGLAGSILRSALV